MPLWRERIRRLLASSHTNDIMRRKLEELTISEGAAVPFWVREMIERYETYVRMCEQGKNGGELDDAARERISARLRVTKCRVAASKERKAARPDWMKDPSLLPKRPPGRP